MTFHYTSDIRLMTYPVRSKSHSDIRITQSAYKDRHLHVGPTHRRRRRSWMGDRQVKMDPSEMDRPRPSSKFSNPSIIMCQY